MSSFKITSVNRDATVWDRIKGKLVKRPKTIKTSEDKEQVATDTYTTPEEANTRAEIIGCNGSHTHTVDGETVYMPCVNMEEYQRTIADGYEDEEDEPKSKSPLIGKTVFFRLSEKGTSIAGVVADVEQGEAKVKLTLPNSDGVLIMSQDSCVSVPVEDLTEIDAVTVKDRDVKSWFSNDPLSKASVANEITDEDGNVVDYRDVTFEGFASTFKGVTPEDRDGDYILPDAFDKWLREFKENPVMLTDHMRTVNNLMGHYDMVRVVSDKGLFVKGRVTNSPHPDAQHVRFQIMEGSLKTLSIGGSFFYKDDLKGIEEIRLHETSLVVVPANPDARFQVRSLDADYAEKVFKAHCKSFGGEIRQKL